MKQAFLNNCQIPRIDLMESFEQKQIQMPNALVLDIVDYIYLSYLHFTKSDKIIQEILTAKIDELFLIYPTSIKDTKVIFLCLHIC